MKDKEGDKLNVGRRSVVAACDWDGDGDLDLLLGNMEGKVLLARNEGGPKQPAYAKPAPLAAGGQEIKVANMAAPAAGDWDGDGDLDLLVGAGDGSVTWFARNEKGLLAAGLPLLPKEAAARTLEGTAPQRSGGRAFVSVADWNGDGLADLIVGDCQFQEQKPPDPPPYDAETLARIQAESLAVAKEMAALRKPPEGESEDARKAREGRLKELMEKRMELSQALRKARPGMAIHGWVWVHLREPAAPVAVPAGAGS